MTPLMIGIYLMLCLLVAVAGRSLRIGPIGVFLLAVLLTPLAVGLVMAVLRPKPGFKKEHSGLNDESANDG
ncbi:MAG: hypothetical protein HQL47_01885 [Gammaproteobacteria bacterium]|nr:hypothetical protein [Gammaproteobacteria bacterium]